MALIQFVNKVWFGSGELKRLATELKRLGIARPLICTDTGIRAAGPLDGVLAALGDAEGAVFDGTPPNPTEPSVEAALRMYATEGCDGLVAVGGGSSIDLAKAVNLRLSHPAPLAQYETAAKGQGKIGEVGPLIAIPTTAGTGTEVSVGTMILTHDGRKSTIASPNLIPTVAICDPDLTLGLPGGLTAATGMDAVTHCIEAVLSPLYNPVADAIGLDGLARALKGGALERAVADGSDAAARSDMMMAAMQGALAFTKGLGAVHSMSHAAGRVERLKLHHGTLNAVILPGVLRFNAPHVPDRMDRLAEAAGVATGGDLPEAIEALNARLGLPASLAELGVTPDLIDEMVAHALKDVSTFTNPAKMTGEDFRTLFLDLL
ncbi:iron-containing alcohol dehydrogenase [Tropicimonas isoalkanivorans]|uniref:Alcohol dehydrogenase, class IV n=1 Tax=Tropicimonas isoalkanivorans TaxID=441112 RepID=A0A1I1HTM2_9RHOB|nr:iron-containing alcohol dehydrogenase [Tropicimonas isoalkanivorans]SFC27211.1 Alcohol dehydrogenase, class IV [Tropicimonas isoalkanivorans]